MSLFMKSHQTCDTGPAPLGTGCKDFVKKYVPFPINFELASSKPVRKQRHKFSITNENPSHFRWVKYTLLKYFKEKIIFSHRHDCNITQFSGPLIWSPVAKASFAALWKSIEVWDNNYFSTTDALLTKRDQFRRFFNFLKLRLFSEVY